MCDIVCDKHELMYVHMFDYVYGSYMLFCVCVIYLRRYVYVCMRPRVLFACVCACDLRTLVLCLGCTRVCVTKHLRLRHFISYVVCAAIFLTFCIVCVVAWMLTACCVVFTCAYVCCIHVRCAG